MRFSFCEAEYKSQIATLLLETNCAQSNLTALIEALKDKEDKEGKEEKERLQKALQSIKALDKNPTWSAQKTDDIEAALSYIFRAFAYLIDPTANRSGGGNAFKYLHWACASYIKERHNGKPILIEDLYKIRQDLNDFESWSRRLHQDKKPNQIDHKAFEDGFQALQKILRPYQEHRAEKRIATANRRMTPEQKQNIMDKTTLIYDGAEGQVVLCHDWDSSKYWGNGTKWCITEIGSRQHFDYYNPRSPVIMYLPKADIADYEAAAEDSRSDNWGVNQKYPCKSFKFAAVDGSLWREDDTTVAAFDAIPQCLITLAEACRSNLAGEAEQLEYLNKYAKLSEILSPRAPKPPYEVDRKKREAFLDTQPQKWVQLIQSIQRSGEHIPDYRTEEKNAFMSEELMRLAPELMKEQDFWMLLIFMQSGMAHKLPDELRDDDDFLDRLGFMTVKGQILTIASERLRNTREFVLKHVEECHHSFFQLPVAMRCDREIAKKAVQMCPRNYIWAHPYDDSSLKALTKTTFNALTRGHTDLRKNVEFARLALSHKEASSSVLRNAPYSIRNNEALIDLKPNEFYEHASKRIRNCKKRAESFAMRSVYGSRYFPRKLKKDKGFILELLKKGATAEILDNLGNDMTTDKAFMMEAISINARAIDHACRNRLFSVEGVFKGDEYYAAAKIAARDHPECLNRISSSDISIERLRELTTINPKAIRHVRFDFDAIDEDQRAEVKDILVDAIKRDITLADELDVHGATNGSDFLRFGGERIAKDILHDYDTISTFLDLLVEHYRDEKNRRFENLIRGFFQSLPYEFQKAPSVFMRASMVLPLEKNDLHLYNPIPESARERWIYDILVYNPKNIERFKDDAKRILSSPDLAKRFISSFVKDKREDEITPYLRFMPALQGLGFDALTNVQNAMKALSQYASMPPRPFEGVDLSVYKKPVAWRGGIRCFI